MRQDEVFDVQPLMTTPLPDICNCDGSQATAYYNTSECDAAPVWVEHKDLKGDLNFGNTADKTENTPRGKGICYKTYVRGKGDLEISFDIGCSADYEGNHLIAKMGDCQDAVPQDWLFLTRCILDTGATGFRGCFALFGETVNNPQSGNSQTSITMAPAAPCSGCACPVRRVQVDVVGEVVDAANVMAVQRVQAMSPAILSHRLNRLVNQQGALALTRATIVYPQIDDLMLAQIAIGKPAQRIKDDFQSMMESDLPNHITLLREKKKASGYIEVNRQAFSDFLAELNGDFRSMIASKAS